MTIFLKTPNGQRPAIIVSEDESVISLKDKVFRKMMFPTNTQVLSYAGRLLEDGHTIS